MSLFVGEKLEFLENSNIFVIFAYELPNRILIVGEFEDFFLLFALFFLSFRWFPMTSTPKRVYYMLLLNEKRHKTQF